MYFFFFFSQEHLRQPAFAQCNDVLPIQGASDAVRVFFYELLCSFNQFPVQLVQDFFLTSRFTCRRLDAMNGVTELPLGLFDGLASLRMLTLLQLNLQSISPSIFADLKNLTFLYRTVVSFYFYVTDGSNVLEPQVVGAWILLMALFLRTLRT
jgi:hypothetical protein